MVAESPRHSVLGRSAKEPLLVLLHLALKSTHPILVLLDTAKLSCRVSVPGRPRW